METPFWAQGRGATLRRAVLNAVEIPQVLGGLNNLLLRAPISTRLGSTHLVVYSQTLNDPRPGCPSLQNAEHEVSVRVPTTPPVPPEADAGATSEIVHAEGYVDRAFPPSTTHGGGIQSALAFYYPGSVLLEFTQDALASSIGYRRSGRFLNFYWNFDVDGTLDRGQLSMRLPGGPPYFEFDAAGDVKGGSSSWIDLACVRYSTSVVRITGRISHLRIRVEPKFDFDRQELLTITRLQRIGLANFNFASGFRPLFNIVMNKVLDVVVAVFPSKFAGWVLNSHRLSLADIAQAVRVLQFYGGTTHTTGDSILYALDAEIVDDHQDP